MPNISGQSRLLIKDSLVLLVKLFVNQEVELWELALESSMAVTEKLTTGNNLELYDKDMIHLVLTVAKRNALQDKENFITKCITSQEEKLG